MRACMHYVCGYILIGEWVLVWCVISCECDGASEFVIDEDYHVLCYQLIYVCSYRMESLDCKRQAPQQWLAQSKQRVSVVLLQPSAIAHAR